MILVNATHLDTDRLEAILRCYAAPWKTDGLHVRIGYTRTTPYSGTCCYAAKRIRVNIGRANDYPLPIATHIARPRSSRRSWWRQSYIVEARDAYELTLLIFLHELYHWLVRKARRNTRQKEGRCDRFAVRALVDHFGAVVRDSKGRAVPRDAWDFQDLEGFVQRARRKRIPRQAKSGAAKSVALRPAARKPMQVIEASRDPAAARQLLLFER
ncbi:MAG: hypothetical protein V3T70_07060 [Phycisphaerae bacterium]